MKRDPWIALGIALLAGAGIWHTRSFPLDSAVWPRAVLLIILVLSCAIAALGFLQRNGGGADGGGGGQAGGRRRLAGIIALMVGYGLAIPWIGFYVATAALLLVYLRLWSSLGVAKLIGITLATLALLYVLASLILALPLPRGLLA